MILKTENSQMGDHFMLCDQNSNSFGPIFEAYPLLNLTWGVYSCERGRKLACRDGSCVRGPECLRSPYVRERAPLSLWSIADLKRSISSKFFQNGRWALNIKRATIFCLHVVWSSWPNFHISCIKVNFTYTETFRGLRRPLSRGGVGWA